MINAFPKNKQSYLGSSTEHALKKSSFQKLPQKPSGANAAEKNAAKKTAYLKIAAKHFFKKCDKFNATNSM
jgi:hypothetical protein